MTISSSFSRTLNAVGLLLISTVLAAAFVAQFALGELPCPLCLLQRVGLVAVGFGLCLNLIYGAKPHHYGIMLVGALYGGSVSIRQILLHIVPGTGVYGSPFLGLHYYTWAGICFFLVLSGTALMLILEGRYQWAPEDQAHRNFTGHRLAQVSFWIFMLLAAGNAVSAFFECGPGICADPPTDYKLLEDLNKSAR